MNSEARPSHRAASGQAPGRGFARSVHRTALGIAFSLLPLACAYGPPLTRAAAALPDFGELGSAACGELATGSRAAEPIRHLSGATADDPSLRVNPFLPWPPDTVAPGLETEPEDPSSRLIGPRTISGFSLGLAASERADWITSARAGLFHERRLGLTGGSAWLVLAADGSQEADQATALEVFVARFRVGLKGRPGVGRFRPTYGAGLLYEWAEVLTVGAGFDRYAVVAALGFEAGPVSGKWDVRLEYQSLLGKSDVEGEVFAGLSLRL